MDSANISPYVLRIDMSKRERLRDFEERKSSDDDAVVASAAHRDWEYIPVHPTTDDTALLERLGLTPEQCIKVDCYWRIGDDVVFLQVCSSTCRWPQRPGLYARWSSASRRNAMLNLVAVVPEAAVSRQLLERVMEEFWNEGAGSIAFSRRKLDEHLALVKLY